MIEINYINIDDLIDAFSFLGENDALTKNEIFEIIINLKCKKCREYFFDEDEVADNMFLSKKICN